MGPSFPVAAAREDGPLSADHVAWGTYSAPSGNWPQLLLPSRGSGSAGSRCPIVELGTKSPWNAALYKGRQIAPKELGVVLPGALESDLICLSEDEPAAIAAYNPPHLMQQQQQQGLDPRPSILSERR